jgi:hypothetical protein
MMRLAHSIGVTVGDLRPFSTWCVARFIVWRELRLRCIYEAGSVRQVNFAHTPLRQPPAANQKNLSLFGSEIAILEFTLPGGRALFLVRSTNRVAINHLFEHSSP